MKSLGSAAIAIVLFLACYGMGYFDGHTAAWDRAVRSRDDVWLRALGAALAPKEPT